jgi:chromosome segregation ATPase
MLPVEEYEALRRQVEELTQYGVKLDNWNDTLQEQLAAMTAERDEYLRDLAAMKNWIDDWHKKDAELDAMTKDRDMAHDLAGHCADQTAAAQADARQADEFTHKALDERDHYLQQLETAQAREQQLREALERRMRSENRWPEYVIDVLATQPDHAALDARLKEERERWADEIDAGKYGPVGAEIAATIRSLP